jgi:hypothetical protein
MSDAPHPAKNSPGGKSGRYAGFRQADPRFASPGFLRATAQQKKQKQNWNRHPEKPKQDVTRRPDLLDFLF